MQTAAGLPGGDTFRAVFDEAPDAMLCVGSDGRVVLMNAAVTRVFGFRPEDLIGELVDLMVPTVLRDAHSTLWRIAPFRSCPYPELSLARSAGTRGRWGGCKPVLGPTRANPAKAGDAKRWA